MAIPQKLIPGGPDGGWFFPGPAGHRALAQAKPGFPGTGRSVTHAQGGGQG
jgi:hypothetical protein